MDERPAISNIRVLLLSGETQRYIDRFDCGSSSINDYLKNHAFDDVSTQTYLFVDGEKDLLISAASLSCSAIVSYKKYPVKKAAVFDAANKHSNDETVFFCDPDHDAEYIYEPRQSLYHAIEIRDFATDTRYQKTIYLNRQSISHYLFVFLCQRIVIEDILTKIGASKIVLYAVPQAVNFYRRAGLSTFEGFMVADKNPYLTDCVPMYYNIGEEYDPNL